MKKFIAPALWITGFQIVSACIGLATSRNMDWYDTLEQPFLTPPDIAFPIVWTSLYVLLALAGWMMWSKRGEAKAKMPLALYWAQMALNWGWSFVFFTFHLIAIGFFWIVALNIAMLAFIILAWKRGYRAPALLVLPTLIWSSFAAYLNYSIWVLN